VDNKRDSPPTYKLAQTFVARCFEKLNTHLSTFVKQVGIMDNLLTFFR
jgi:hypothetical protein